MEREEGSGLFEAGLGRHAQLAQGLGPPGRALCGVAGGPGIGARRRGGGRREVQPGIGAGSVTGLAGAFGLEVGAVAHA